MRAWSGGGDESKAWSGRQGAPGVIATVFQEAGGEGADDVFPAGGQQGGAPCDSPAAPATHLDRVHRASMWMVRGDVNFLLATSLTALCTVFVVGRCTPLARVSARFVTGSHWGRSAGCAAVDGSC